jgi:hypothetical protein
MAVVATSELRKLPVWPTVRASYAIVLRNFGQLVRISWLWLLILLLINMAMHWLDWSSSPEAGGTGTMVTAIVSLAGLIYLPALASVEVAWHRLILLGERVEGACYLRLDRIVWRYALAIAALSVPILAPLLLVGIFVAYYSLPPQDIDLQSSPVVVGGFGVGAIAAVLVQRISTVLPSIALGESLSLMNAWRAARGNTTPLLYAHAFCGLPLFMMALALMLADISSAETYVLVLTAASIMPLLLVPPWVALWSLLYRHFILQRADLASSARP